MTAPTDPPAVPDISNDLPSRAANQADFTTVTNRWFASLPGWQAGLIGLADWMKSTALMVRDYMISAQQSSASAQQSVSDASDRVVAATSEADRARGYADNIAGVANFKGAWANASGQASMPSTYHHDSRFWQLMQPLADVTSVEPGTDSTVWVQTGAIVKYDEYTASATWEKHPAARMVFVEAWGAGAGGGNSSDSQQRCSGGAGGSYAMGFRLAASLPETVPVVVGAGGVGGTLGSGNDGSAGGHSEFADITAYGGHGGQGSNSAGLPSLPGGGLQAYAPTDFTKVSVAVRGTFEGGFGGSGYYNQTTADGIGTKQGGSSEYGGAGGGGPDTVASRSVGGISVHAGNGGSAGDNVDAQPGGFPAGGGGAARHGNAGDGANGLVRVYQW